MKLSSGLHVSCVFSVACSFFCRVHVCSVFNVSPRFAPSFIFFSFHIPSRASSWHGSRQREPSAAPYPNFLPAGSALSLHRDWRLHTCLVCCITSFHVTCHVVRRGQEPPLMSMPVASRPRGRVSAQHFRSFPRDPFLVAVVQPVRCPCLFLPSRGARLMCSLPWLNWLCLV